MDERSLRMALMCVSEPGDPAMARLVCENGVEKVWEQLQRDGTSMWGRRAKDLDVAEVQRNTRRHGMGFLIPGDPEWPMQVDALGMCGEVSGFGGPPLGLWVRGEQRDLSAFDGRAVAVVGSRAASAYGQHVAGEIGADVAERGWTVVSGGAFGIDAAAHRGALATGGNTVCVLACGLNLDYPRAHHDLLAKIAARGALVGELAPDAYPTRSRFLGRNRLIAALSTGTVIVEAALRSGAKNTVNWAETIGRPVMAVPGPATSATSATPHELIRSRSAELVTSGLDVLELLAPVGQELLPLPEVEERPIDGLSRRQRGIFEHVPGGGDGATTAEITAASGFPRGLVAATLDELVRAGFVLGEGGRWRLRPGSVG